MKSHKLIPVKDIDIGKVTVNALVNEMHKSGGFSARKIGDGLQIIEEMIKDKKCVKFLSFPADIISTGTRGVIKSLLKEKFFDVVITTCGTLDHDLARVWKDYYCGSFELDDIELHKKSINRLGNIIIPNENYGIILEKKMQEILKKIYEDGKKDGKKEEYSTPELIWKFGEQIQNEKNAEESIIYWSYKNKIPIFVPGITDGAFGFQCFMFWLDHKDFKINLFKDENKISEIVFNAKKTGALMIGGGISKHHTIWWNQFTGGLSYAVYITTAQEYDGSLSGARTREAISWGKLNEKASHITIDGDATIILPMMACALFERLEKTK